MVEILSLEGPQKCMLPISELRAAHWVYRARWEGEGDWVISNLLDNSGARLSSLLQLLIWHQSWAFSWPPQSARSKPALYQIFCIGIPHLKNKILLLEKFRSNSCKQYYCYKEFQKLESISYGFCLIMFRDIVFSCLLRWCSSMLSAGYFFYRLH